MIRQSAERVALPISQYQYTFEEEVQVLRSIRPLCDLYNDFVPIALWRIPKTNSELQLRYFSGFTISQLVLRLGGGNKITYICLICGQPILVGLSYTVQPCSRVTNLLNPHDDRLASFCNTVFPASNFCKHTSPVDFYVIFLVIVRLRTLGLEVSFVRSDVFGELLSEFSVVSFPPIGKSKLTSLLASPAPESTMYTVTPVPAVLSYTKSPPSSV